MRMNDKTWKLMDDKSWEKIIFCLKSYADGIKVDVFDGKDEIKALGELALLNRIIEGFLKEYWDK